MFNMSPSPSPPCAHTHPGAWSGTSPLQPRAKGQTVLLVVSVGISRLQRNYHIKRLVGGLCWEPYRAVGRLYYFITIILLTYT